MSDIPLTRALDRKGGTLYRRAAGMLRQAILSGQVQPGAALPSEAELAAGFAVSLITVRQALRELENEGLITKHSGRAAVVTAGAPRMARLASTLEDVIVAAGDARLELFSYRPRHAPEAARALLLAPGTKCYSLHGRLLLGSNQIKEVRICFPPAIGERLQRADFDDQVVFRTVQRRLGVRLSGALVTIGAELADPALARRLNIQAGAAVLVTTMLYRDDAGVPVEYTEARQPAASARLSYEVRA